MKSFVRMTPQEKAALVHELFPDGCGLVVQHCYARAEEVQNGKLIIRKWLPHSAAASWPELAGCYLAPLQDHQDEVRNSALSFGKYLFRKRMICFTKDSIQNYLEYGFCKDQRLALALRLFLLE